MGQLAFRFCVSRFRLIRGAACIVYVILVMSCQLFPAPCGSFGQSQQTDIDRNVRLLRSSNLNEKYAASEYLKKLTKDELGPTALAEAKDVFLAEIQAVRRFRAYAVRPNITLAEIPEELRPLNSETWNMYFINLRDIVAKAADIKLLPEMIEFRASPNEILGYGEAAIDPLIRVLQEPVAQVKYRDISRQIYAVQVLAEYMKEKERGYVARDEVRKKIGKALVESLVAAEDERLKISVIKSLGDIGDEVFIPVLEEVARNDNYSYVAKSDPKIEKDMPAGRSVVRYPARECAQEALEKIRQKKGK